MCYSKEKSQVSFLTNLITSYILYNYSSNNTSHKILALFFVFVGLMQLFDWIFWENQDISNSKQANINFAFTKIAMFANHLQPIVLAYLIYYFNGKIGNMSQIIMGIYIIAITIYTINAYNTITYTLEKKIPMRKFLSKDEIKPTLYWQWNSLHNSLPVYLIFLTTIGILAYENFKFPINIIFAFINVFTFLLSGYYYKGQSLGRWWCNYASFIPLFILLISNLVKI